MLHAPLKVRRRPRLHPAKLWLVLFFYWKKTGNFISTQLKWRVNSDAWVSFFMCKYVYYLITKFAVHVKDKGSQPVFLYLKMSISQSSEKKNLIFSENSAFSPLFTVSCLNVKQLLSIAKVEGGGVFCSFISRTVVSSLLLFPPGGCSQSSASLTPEWWNPEAYFLSSHLLLFVALLATLSALQRMQSCLHLFYMAAKRNDRKSVSVFPLKCGAAFRDLCVTGINCAHKSSVHTRHQRCWWCQERNCFSETPAALQGFCSGLMWCLF